MKALKRLKRRSEYDGYKWTKTYRRLEGKFCCVCRKQLQNYFKNDGIIYSKQIRNSGQCKHYCEKCYEEKFGGVKIKPIQDLNLEDFMMLTWGLETK